MRMSSTPSPQVINGPSLRRKEIVEVYGLCYFHVQKKIIDRLLYKIQMLQTCARKGYFYLSDEKGRGLYSHPVVERLLMVMITDLQLHVLVLSK